MQENLKKPPANSLRKFAGGWSKTEAAEFIQYLLKNSAYIYPILKDDISQEGWIYCAERSQFEFRNW